MRITMENRYLYRGITDKGEWDGEWVFGHYAFIPKSEFCAHDRHFIARVLPEDKDDLDHELIIPETLGQCTGLKDKNGKLIFEGDIVLNEENNRCVIVYSSDTTGFCMWCERYDIRYNLSDRNNLEVIGNIHEKHKS